jgi:hypothetical protein
VVFSIRVNRPRSLAGRIWNAAWDLIAFGSLALIALRLAGVVSWPWWQVLTPLWVSGALMAAVLLVLLALIVRSAGRPGGAGR